MEFFSRLESDVGFLVKGHQLSGAMRKKADKVQEGFKRSEEIHGRKTAVSVGISRL